MNSLERSLQAGLILSLASLLLLTWWGGALAGRLLTESVVYTRLQRDGRALFASVEIDGAGGLGLDERTLRLGLDYDRGDSGRWYQVLGVDVALVSRSADGTSLPRGRLAPGSQQRLRIRAVTGDTLVWRAGYRVNGVPFTLSLAQDVGAIEQRIDAFQLFFGVVSLVLVVAVVGVQHWILRHALGRLGQVRDDIARLEHGRVEALTEDVPSEILPLVREFNQMLERYDQRLRQSRNAVGNLAHALKQPLNLLVRASDAPTFAPGEASDTIAQNVDRIRQLIESELRRARVAGRGGAGHRFDLASELDVLRDLLLHLYADKTVEVRITIGSGTEMYHDRQDMLELFGNLLDNAVKWARSVVILHVRSVRGVLIDVEDDGPGCTPEEIRLMTGRGVRLDESVSGHGLGLAIAKDIVGNYGGRLEFGQSGRLGGLRATVYLPERVERETPT